MAARLLTMGEDSDQASAEDPPGGFEQHRAARCRLANQVRRLVRDLNRLTSDVPALNAASDLVAEAVRLLDSPDRQRLYEIPLEEINEQVEDRLRAEAHDHSLYRGNGNPLAPPLVVSNGDDAAGTPMVVGTVQLDRNWDHLAVCTAVTWPDSWTTFSVVLLDWSMRDRWSLPDCRFGIGKPRRWTPNCGSKR